MPNQYGPWTKREDQYLKRKWNSRSTNQIAEHLGRTHQAVATRANRLGLKKPKGWAWKNRHLRKPNSTNGWSKEDVAKLKAMCKTHVRREIAVALGRTMGAVKSKMVSLGLFMNPKVVRAYQSSHPNRGTFKKGGNGRDLPLLAVTVRYDKRNTPSVYIKVSHEGKGQERWKLLSVYLWELAVGPVPEKHVVAFKDGNPMNVNVNNLMLLTQAENMIRNSEAAQMTDRWVARMMATKNRKVDMEAMETFLKYPELLQTQKLIYKQKRKIYNVGSKKKELSRIA